MYSKMGPTASNSSHLPTKASFPESSSLLPPSSPHLSPPLPSSALSLTHSPTTFFELWGTSPQSLWLSPLCKYLTVLVKQEASFRLACASVCESNRVCMCELIAQSVPAVEADVCVEPERNCERASESPLLSGSAPAVRWIPTLWPTHGRGCRIQGFKVKQESMCVCILTPPPHTAAFGPMSLMQIWTKLYSQLGRPLPKVLVLFASLLYLLCWIRSSVLRLAVILLKTIFIFDVTVSNWKLLYE